MCGGGSPATITQPDYEAYDRQFERQQAAISRMTAKNEGSIQRMQMKLNRKVVAKQETLTALADQKKTLAENTSAQAMRLAALMGPPPPEKSASAPVVGRLRGAETKKGKSALRIGLDSSSRMSQGTGLNIT
jgi:hypothetical protein